MKLIPVLSGLAVSAVSSLALADIPMPHNGGGGGCSMAATSTGQLTIVGVMFVVGIAALFVSRRRSKG